MSNLSAKLLRLKDQDEQAGKMVNRMEGEILQSTNDLKKRFGVSTVEKAEMLLKKKTILKEKKRNALEADIEVLEAEYYAT